MATFNSLIIYFNLYFKNFNIIQKKTLNITQTVVNFETCSKYESKKGILTVFLNWAGIPSGNRATILMPFCHWAKPDSPGLGDKENLVCESSPKIQSLKWIIKLFKCFTWNYLKNMFD